MKRIRRQNPRKLRTKDCLVPARKNRVPLARMEQVDPKSRAAHILGIRGNKKGLITLNEIGGKLTGTEFTQADPRSAQRWAKKQPNLPERMVETGQMSPADFPKSLRSFLKKSTNGRK